jgi:uroporphyrinogen-III synthase
VRDVCDGSLDVVVLLTGVGTRALIGAADSMGVKDDFLTALNGLTVFARSPKPARVLRQNDIHIDVMPSEPYTSADLLESIKEYDLQGRDLAVQAYGSPNGFLTQGLEDRGANVREVTLYTWGLPDDTSPVIRMIDDLGNGAVDALAFTSQPQVRNLLTIACQANKERQFRESLETLPVAVASVGPVCSRRLREMGLRVDVEPEHVHMGNMIIALAEHFSEGPAPEN